MCDGDDLFKKQMQLVGLRTRLPAHWADGGPESYITRPENETGINVASALDDTPWVTPRAAKHAPLAMHSASVMRGQDINVHAPPDGGERGELTRA